MDDIHQQVQERFGALAQGYVKSAVHATGYSLDRLIELVAPGPGQHLLDVATGGGHVARAMASSGARVIASDLTAPMLHAAREHITASNLAAEYLRADAQHLPFQNSVLDGVTCRLAAHHFPDPIAFVRECARVIRPGGIVGLVDQAGPDEVHAARYANAFEKLRDPSHVWEHSQEDWESFFRDAGLRVRHSEIARTRLDFAWWTRMQNNDEETILRLRVMLKQAPKAIAEFLEPAFAPGGEISFSLWQLILVAEK